MKRWLSPLMSALSFTLACGGGDPARFPTAEPSGDDPASATPSRDDPASATPPRASDSETAHGEATAEAPPAEGGDGAGSEFVLRDSDGVKQAHGVAPSKIKASATEAAMKFVVLNKETGPIEGIVISLTAPDGTKYYTPETDAKGYTELLVPVGAEYDLVYLSLGRQEISAKVNVTNEPNQNIRLTLRYKRHDAPASGDGEGGAERFVLGGVTFDTGKATIRPESFARLDTVVEYMTHKKRARIEISGHTDNVGNPQKNKALSLSRARACRDYLVSKGIDESRIEAIGYGDERPIAPNDTDAGRQQNRRIEVTEL